MIKYLNFKTAFAFLTIIVGGNLILHAENLTLQQCIDIGLQNSFTLQNAKLEEKISKAKVGEVTSSGLPQISATVGLQHNLRLRNFYGEGSGTPNIIAGGAVIPKGQLYSINNIFQLPNVLDGSVTVSQLLFSSSYIIGLRAAKTYKELSKISTTQTELETKVAITKAYYMSLINAERVKIFNVNINRLDSVIYQTKKLYQNGFVEKIDIDRLEVALNNLNTERENFKGMMDLSMSLLKFQMGLADDNTFTLADDISKLNISTEIINDSKSDYANRNEYKQLQTVNYLNQLDLKNKKYSILPTLVASLNLGTFTSNNKFGKLFVGDNFLPGMKPWSTYGLAQVGLNIPIFGGGSRHYLTQQTSLKLKQSENNIKKFEQAADLQSKQSSILYNNSVRSLENQKRNMALATSIVNVSEKKYKAGTGSNLDLITAESSLKEAQINYYEALYNALVNKIDYEVAKGNFK